MKAILMSIRPQWVAKILNGEKTIEIRKSIPKCDLPIDVYIYCTKDKKYGYMHNGKSIRPQSVVAKFTLNKVEKIKYHFGYYDMGEWTESYILENACLSAEELDNYLQASKEYDEKKVSRVYGYAWHIDNLIPFDEPKELREFRQHCDKHFSWWKNKCLDCKAYTPDADIEDYCNKNKLALTRAPQSYCFIEV